MSNLVRICTYLAMYSMGMVTAIGIIQNEPLYVIAGVLIYVFDTCYVNRYTTMLELYKEYTTRIMENYQNEISQHHER